MSPNVLLLVVVLVLVWSLVSYRATRFIILDSMFDGTRDAFHDWLLNAERSDDLVTPRNRLHRWYRRVTNRAWKWRKKIATKDCNTTREIALQKIHELTGCPYCMSVWTSACICVAHWWVVESYPMPVWLWLATCSGALIWYRYMET